MNKRFVTPLYSWHGPSLRSCITNPWQCMRKCNHHDLLPSYHYSFELYSFISFYFVRPFACNTWMVNEQTSEWMNACVNEWTNEWASDCLRVACGLRLGHDSVPPHTKARNADTTLATFNLPSLATIFLHILFRRGTAIATTFCNFPQPLGAANNIITCKEKSPFPYLCYVSFVTCYRKRTCFLSLLSSCYQILFLFHFFLLF